jgi:hypothetical protein
MWVTQNELTSHMQVAGWRVRTLLYMFRLRVQHWASVTQ